MIIKRPEQYHGNNNKRPFFEGWYHKMSTSNGETLVLIPGIYRSGVSEYETAFLMIYQGSNRHLEYIPYHVNDFECNKKNYSLHLGENYFSLDKVKLNLNTEKINLKGTILSEDLKPWPVTFFEPGCMGWYAYVPTMECFHGILSMNHTLNGQLSLNKSKLNFDGGKGYIEKDWGENFPKNWIWAQSNHFQDSDLSVSISLATVPWKKSYFSGYIVGVQHRDTLYRFTPYRKSKITHLHYNETFLEWHLKSGGVEIQFNVERGTKSGLLYAPDEKDMIPKVAEYLDGKINCKLIVNGECILEDQTNKAALEIIGDIDTLIASVK